MKQTSKRVLSLLMALTMLIGMMTAVSVSAATTTVLEMTFDTEEEVALMENRADSATPSWDATGGKDGKGAIKYTAKKAGDGIRFMNSPTITWEKGATYTISFKYKASKAGITGWFAPNFALTDGNGESMNFKSMSPAFSTDWKETSMTFTIADFVESGSNPTSLGINSKDTVVMCNFYKVAEGDVVWIDDLKITKTVVLPGEVVELDLSGTSKTYLALGETSKINVVGTTVEGDVKAVTEGVTFASDNTEVATVAADGTVTAKCEGAAVITATCGDAKKSILMMVGTTFRENKFDSGTISPNVTSETWGEKNVKWENAQELDTNFKRNGAASLHFKKLDRYTGNGSTSSQGPLYTILYSEADKFPAYGALQLWYYENGEDTNRDYLIQMNSGATKSNDEMADWSTMEKYPYLRFNFSLRPAKNNLYTTFGDGFKNGEWGTVDYTLPRTKGWHQLVEVVTPEGFKVYIDGQLFADVPKKNQKNGGITIHRIIPNGVNEGNNELWVDDMALINLAVTPKAPYVESVTIEGAAQVDHTLKATAVVKDSNKEDTTSATYQWQVKTADGWDDITNATSDSYKITSDMLGKQLRVLVTPVSNNDPKTGTPFPSEATVAITPYTYPPSANGLTVTGSYEVGSTLEAKWNYVPSQSNIEQGDSVVIWETSATADGTFKAVQTSTDEKYTVRVADAGQFLRTRVIVKDKNGLAAEKELVSEAKAIEGKIAFYVSADGDDNNIGSLDKPFKTIEKARDTIRELNVLPKGGITVYIRGGIYEISETIAFTKEDSGTEECPIDYIAYNDERVSFIGGQTLDSSKVQKVTDKALLDRLVEEDAKDHLYMLDLKAQGVEMDPLASYGWSGGYDKVKRIYMNNVLLTEARWPNDDQAQNLVDCRPLTAAKDGIDEDKINTTKTPIMYEYPDPENRSEKWTIKKGDAYIGGAIVYFWASSNLRIDNVDAKKKVVTSLDPSSYAAVKGVGWGPQYSVYFSNIFEEIDKPGESYVDREKGILYFYPTDDVKGAELVISTLKKNMISMKEVSNVSFRGIDFQNTVETPVVLTSCENIRIEDGDISNISANGIKIVGGKDILVTGCNIYTTSISPISISGVGNRTTLESSGVVIENNNFHNTCITPSSASDRAAVGIQNSVGVLIRNNEFNDMKFGALHLGNSNNIYFEYNDVLNTGQLTSDAGTIYWGREVDTLGNTVRYNYFENTGSTLVANYLNAHQSTSFFVDDASTGGHVYGNVFFNGGSNTQGSGSATTGNGPEFSNLWGNISIATDFDKMNRAYMMRNWPDTTGMSNLYGVKVPAGTAASSWLYMNGMRTPFGGGDSSNMDDMRKYIWSDAWKEYYKGTQWEGALKHYSKENYEGAKALFDKQDYAGVLTFLGEHLTHERTNKIHDNVALGAIISDSLADHYNNYVGTQHQITEEDKALFVDFDNKDFTLTKEGLAKIQKIAPEFKEIPFNQIGMKSDVGGAKPVVTVNPELVTGVAAPGSKITTSYTFTDGDGDAEGGTKVYWWVSDTANGKFSKIWEYEGREFKLTDDYAGRYLKYEVVPYDVTQMRGVTVMSDPIAVRSEGVADISGLSAAITEANDLLKSVTIGDEAGQYPQTAADLLKAAVAKASEVANNADALQYQVNKAEDELKAQIDLFLASKISSLAGLEVDYVSLNTLLKDKENWKNYDKGTLTFNEDGSLTFAEADFGMLGYEGKKFKNAEFSFKMKAEILDNTVAAPQNAWVGIYLRNSDPSDKVWVAPRQGFMIDMKQHLIQLQEYPQPGTIYKDTILNDKNFVPGKEYDMTIGLYDIPDSNELMFVMTMDGETIYSKKMANYGLYDKENYLAFSVGNIKLTLSPFYADTVKLDSVVTDADEFAETVVAGDGYGEYPEEAVKAFEEALENAKKIAANEDAVQSEVDEAVLALQKAMNALKASSTGSGTVKADGEVAINYNHEIADITVDKAVKDLTVKIDTKQPQPEIKIASDDVELVIPAMTEISGDFKAPLLGSEPSANFISGEVSKVYGQGAELVEFDPLVRVVLKGEAGKNVAYKNEKGRYTNIAKTIKEDSAEAALKAIGNQKAVKMTVGNDIVIYTYLMTEFVTYEPTVTTPPTTTPTVKPTTPSTGGTTGGGFISVGGNNNTQKEEEKEPVKPSKFTDIIGHWAEADINDMAEQGIVSGVTKTTFVPERSITRAEFAALMTRALGLNSANDESVFVDVATDAWYAKEVAAAASAGLIVGYDGNFRPDDTITREEMAVVIMKAYAFLGKTPASGQIEKFADKGDISDWAVTYVDQAVSSGMISGMSADTFVPKANATRAQVTSLIKRLLNA